MANTFGHTSWTGLDFDRETRRLYAQPFHDD